MLSKRQLQVGEVVKRNFSLVLQQEGPYIYGDEVLVTVTSVRMSPDMGIAKIYLSIFNNENKQEVMLLLEEQTHRLRQLLAERVKRHVRRIPYIEMYIDDTLDEMYRLKNVFKDLRADNQMGDDADTTISEES